MGMICLYPIHMMCCRLGGYFFNCSPLCYFHFVLSVFSKTMSLISYSIWYVSDKMAMSCPPDCLISVSYPHNMNELFLLYQQLTAPFRTGDLLYNIRTGLIKASPCGRYKRALWIYWEIGPGSVHTIFDWESKGHVYS